MDPLVVKIAQLHVISATQMQVSVANGENICTASVCKECVTIQGSRFLVPFNVLPLGGCDMILGVQRLRTLGKI